MARVMLQRRSSPRASRVWRLAFRLGLARESMPFWRVVCEVRPSPSARFWPPRSDVAVTAVFVWANTPEEAEGLAALALEGEALSAITADATRVPPALRPSRLSVAVARGPLAYMPRIDGPTPQVAPRRTRLN